ncbi:MAG: SANT/Myb domain-containing protein [Holosporales bacterium]|nr:SANT/Myb domain-containing protein [Holosporales bacterium]
MINNRRFEPWEDNIIRMGVQNIWYHWNLIAKRLPRRTATQCKNRWFSHLKNNIR